MKKPQMRAAPRQASSPLTDLSPNDVGLLVQHHMAHSSGNLHDVARWHMDDNVWNYIGYNYWIAFDGTIYKCRGFKQGAHVSNHNHYTYGIGYQGHFGSQNMTEEQLESGIILNAWLAQECGLSADEIVGHGDVAASACPERNFRMSELKDGVEAALEKGVSASELNAKIVYDGNDVKGFVEDGRTYVQLRNLADLVGVQIDYDNDTKEITFDGKVVDPIVIEGRSYLPVREVAEDIGLSVDWDQDSRTVLLK
ncbi:stalk domain-containing protein [Salsuginibacillus kocurii]|uniref:stalk domain-containing protein n=1 Tax=Salsuginibacillus kocurii TaxID=427078 RepID=UPI00037D8E3C|nr:N-acetylmuramoyl-L-alanine amidase [Salsuginibacillus kocurii]